MKKIKLLTSLAGLSALSMGLVPTIASCGCSKTASNEITLNTKVSKLEVQAYESQKHASFYFKQSNLDSATDTKVKIANLKLDGIEASSRDKLLKSRTDSAGNIQVYIDTQILRSGIVSKANEATFDLVFTNKKTNFEQTFTGFKITWKENPVVKSGYIEAKNETGEDITLQADNSEDGPDIQYSFDGTSWNNININSDDVIINDGVTVYLKGNNPHGFSSENNWSTIYMVYVAEEEEPEEDQSNVDAKFTISGTVMALLNNGGENKNVNADEIPCDYCFADLFYTSDAITHVDKDFLPATSLKDNCYDEMFLNCDNLVSAPNLPSTTLTKGCYYQMFRYCEELEVPPIIKATTLAADSCNEMFSYCSNLKAKKYESGTTPSTVFFTCPNESIPSGAVEGMFDQTYYDIDSPQPGESFYYEEE